MMKILCVALCTLQGDIALNQLHTKTSEFVWICMKVGMRRDQTSAKTGVFLDAYTLM